MEIMFMFDVYEDNVALCFLGMEWSNHWGNMFYGSI